jgi:HSP20 family protein
MKRSFVLLVLMLVVSVSSSNAAINNPYAHVTTDQTYLGHDLEVNPVQEIITIQKKLSGMFDTMIRDGYLKTYESSPAMDFQDLGKEFLAKIDLPGLSKEAINLEVTEKSIVVSGTREEGQEESDSSGFYRKERSSSSFRREISLPSQIKVEEVTAKYENGVLIVTLPKVDINSSDSRIIEIK